MNERYFVSYFGNFEGRVGANNTVVITEGKLETDEHMRGLTEYLAGEAGYPVVILSLYHMCTVEEQEEEGLEDTAWVDEALGDCGDRCGVCGVFTAGEVCQQCGKPLCPLCFEKRGGFCMDCPTEDYEPHQEEEEEG